MKKLLNLFLSLFLVLGLAGGAFGETLTIQPTTLDSYIISSNPDANVGSYTVFYVMASTTPVEERPVFRFEWPTLSISAIVSNVTINLYRYADVGSAGGKTYWIYALQNAPDFTEAVTWNKYDGVNVWNPPHVLDPPSGPYTTYLGASLVVNNFVSPGWLLWDISELFGWLRSEGDSNFMLRCSNGSADGNGFAVYSREYTTDTTLRPKMIITYTIPKPYSYIF